MGKVIKWVDPVPKHRGGCLFALVPDLVNLVKLLRFWAL